jgi:trehalose 6-phosphate phosphatase
MLESKNIVPSLDLRLVSLLLDVDGTLLDLAPTPESVAVPASLIDTIAKLSRLASGAVAFISGRQLATIDLLFAPLRLPTVGCHGAEIRAAAEGDVQSGPELPESVRLCVHEIASIAPGVILEDKGHTLAIHYRSAPAAGGAVLRALLEQRAFFAAQDIQILNGKAVIEVKPRWFSKGTGLRHLMQHAPFAERTPVFLGDDTTDEDVFRVLPDYEGIGFSVGRKIDGASYVFSAPQEVRRWLTQLADEP